MRTRTFGVLLGVGLGGCSFVGARVPSQPPAPVRCAAGVIGLDAVGTALFAYPLGAIVVDLANPNRRGGIGDVALPVAIPLLAVITGTYVGGLVYGVRGRGRCFRLKEEERARARAIAAQPPPPPSVPTDVIGTAPLHCAIIDSGGRGAGACYFEDAACQADAERGGGACELRTAAWCFDTQGIADVSAQTRCAVGQDDCEARRLAFTTDRTQSVTTCSRYLVRSP